MIPERVQRLTGAVKLRVGWRRLATQAGQGALIGSLAMLAGCSPKSPPPDLVKTQRQALDQAKAVEDVLRKQADDQGRSIDDASR